MSDRRRWALRTGSSYLLIGGVLQAAGVALALVFIVLLALNPGGEPPAIMFISALWLPMAVALTIAAFVSWRAFRHARANQGIRAGLNGLIAGVFCLLPYVPPLYLGMPWWVLAPLLLVSTVSLVGALFCIAAGDARPRPARSEDGRLA